jgi:hypothetical protein
MSAAAAACTTRKTMSISVPVAAAHAADAAVKAPISTRKLVGRIFKAKASPVGSGAPVNKHFRQVCRNAAEA